MTKKILGITIVLILAGVILLVSVARASLSLTLKKEKENVLRKVPIKLLIEQEDGGIKTEVYLLPPVRTLPSSVFYNIKRIRDLLWIGFCQEKDEKISLAMLLADKKMAEAQILFVNGQADQAMKAAEDGIDLWERAKKMWQSLDKDDEKNEVVKTKIDLAGRAYEKILRRAEGAVDVNQAEYQQIVDRLERINEEKKE